LNKPQTTIIKNFKTAVVGLQVHCLFNKFWNRKAAP